MTIEKLKAPVLVFAGLMIVSLTAMADDFYVYPAKGQKQAQQDKDVYECQKWATKQSGFDPTDRPKTIAAPPPPKKGGLIGGAVGGAIIGEIAGDAGKGAAIGAVVGKSRQTRGNEQAAEKYQADVNQASSEYEQNRGSYNSAYSACLTGRNYTVSPK